MKVELAICSYFQKLNLPRTFRHLQSRITIKAHLTFFIHGQSYAKLFMLGTDQKGVNYLQGWNSVRYRHNLKLEQSPSFRHMQNSIMLNKWIQVYHQGIWDDYALYCFMSLLNYTVAHMDPFGGFEYFVKSGFEWEPYVIT